MAEIEARRKARLSIDVEPDLRRRIWIAAAVHDLSVRDYVAGVSERAIAAEAGDQAQDEPAAWSQLSAQAFIRDWASEEDQVYDQFSQG